MLLSSKNRRNLKGKKLRLFSFETAMKNDFEKIDRIFLWLILTIGFISLLFYGLASFLARPTTETITTHAPAALNSNNNSMRTVNFKSSNSK
jgi:Na+-driven multidrug efflux pump